MGRHLIDYGLKPGGEMGKLLERAFEAQLDGDFTNLEEGLEWLAANQPLASNTE